MTDNKRIAKNTIFMYVRMIFVMVVSLYTSRVVLHTLGVEDYGTYQVVGGIVGFLSILNTTLSTGTSRFLMFELGAGDKERLQKTFSTLLNAHYALATVVVILAETIGLWFVYNKLIIPANRMNAAIVTYHISVLTAFFGLTQTPYSASIKSHERMDIYAYTSIIEVSAKLLIVYLLAISPIDKLVFYALLLAIVSIAMMIFYRWYCVHKFQECRYSFSFDKKIFIQVTSYCGWNLFSNTAGVLNSQGMIILLNMFFNPGVVTALSVATTVKNAANSFVENYRVASVPQIVKQYAAGDFENSKKLVLSSTKYSYFLLFLMGLPIFLVSPELLMIWLKIVPDYSVIFLRFIIVICFFELFNGGFYTAINAVGRIREYSIIYPTVMFLCFPVVYFSFKMDYSPIAVTVVMLVANAIISLIVMPLLVVKIANYSFKEIYDLFKTCLFVTLPSLPIPFMVYYFLQGEGIWMKFLLTTVTSVANVVLCVWFIGIDHEMRSRIISFVKSKIQNNGLFQADKK